MHLNMQHTYTCMLKPVAVSKQCRLKCSQYFCADLLDELTLGASSSGSLCPKL